ncbi:hypothetical protein RhiJN_09413 [Ceratobasidium sp. AG-Ba]|nr:hypothetical protein RhiJN_09413 [Ceratobasidium sp. AG-Ba]QRW10215.1 hypothetical protein RhiLY_09214 [Ceratobasidium sp. AG-Ba]
MFYAVAPVVWKCVEGVHNFLCLLPDIKVASDSYEIIGLILSPRNITPSQQSRSRLYISSIKRIKIYTERAQYYQVMDWKALISHVWSHPLPPKLQELDLTHGGRRNDVYQPLWIKMFACNSLVEVHAAVNSRRVGCEINYRDLVETVELLSRKSPDIRKLALFPWFVRRLAAWNPVVASLSPADQSYPGDGTNIAEQIFQPLASFSRLRDLTCNSYMLRYTLGIIGSLPQLEHLTVCNTRQMHGAFGDVAPPSESFSALSHLTLYLQSQVEVEALLRWASAFPRLGTLEMYIDLTQWVFMEDAWAFTTLFPLLGRLSSIQHFYINPSGAKHESPLILSFGDQIVVDSLASMSLKTIRLDWTMFALPILDLVEPFPDLKSRWAHVTYLYMPMQPISTHQLPCFAALPNLEHLVVILAISNHFGSEHHFDKPIAVAFQVLEGSIDSIISLKPEEMDATARFILSLWPNISRIVWPVKYYVESQLNLVRLLNERLATLQEPCT